MPVALKSKQRTLAAIGKFRSGEMDKLSSEHKNDSGRALELAQQIPKSDHDFKPYSRDELESKIIELDMTIRWIEELLNKYQDSINSDKEISKELRQQHLKK